MKLAFKDKNSEIKPELTVFISNTSEDVWPFIESMTDPMAKDLEMKENDGLADLHLFSCSDESELLFIAPYSMDPVLIQYYKSLFKPKFLEILTPSRHTGSTCTDVMNDPELLSNLINISKNYKKLTLLTYSSSSQFYKLKNFLIKQGVNVYTPESPSDDCAWTVNFFGSKSGIRQLGQSSKGVEPDFELAEGLICVGIEDASQIAADRYLSEHGVVIKTNKGHSGSGVLIFREGDLPGSYEKCVKSLYTILSKEKYWSLFPIIIEDLVNVNYSIAGGFPNVEFKIQKSGEINFLYTCGLRVTREGVFQGNEIGDEVINQRYLARITDLGFYIGERYAYEGYRGYFDVDCIAAKNYKIYVTESNTRRTGGTHAYKTALKLLGKDGLDDKYIVHENMFLFGGDIKLTYSKLLNIMNPLLYNKKTQNGIVFPASNLLKIHKLAYIVIADSQKEAHEQETKMKDLLKRIE